MTNSQIAKEALDGIDEQFLFEDLNEIAQETIAGIDPKFLFEEY